MREIDQRLLAWIAQAPQHSDVGLLHHLGYTQDHDVEEAAHHQAKRGADTKNSVVKTVMGTSLCDGRAALNYGAEHEDRKIHRNHQPANQCANTDMMIGSINELKP